MIFNQKRHEKLISKIARKFYVKEMFRKFMFYEKHKYFWNFLDNISVDIN